MSLENKAMKAGGRAARAEHDKSHLRGTDGEVGTESLEGGYGLSASVFKAHHTYKGLVSFIWELNDLRWGRNPQPRLIITTTRHC